MAWPAALKSHPEIAALAAVLSHNLDSLRQPDSSAGPAACAIRCFTSFPIFLN